MAVRAFNGTSDDLVCSPGAAATMTYGTAVFTIKQTSSRTLEVEAFSLRTSGGTLRAVFGITGTGTIKGVFFNGADYDDTAPSVTSGLNRWLTVVFRKGTGSTVGRWSIYDHTADTWYHANAADTTLANWTAIGGTGTIGFWDGDQYPPIRIAARALWVNSLPWSADTTGDAAIEAAGLEVGVQNWVDAGASLVHELNQDSTSTPVTDLVGDSDQTSISGTSVVTDDDPPGFSFTSGGAGATGTLDATGPAATLTVDADAASDGTLDLTGPAATLTVDADAASTADLATTAPAATFSVDGTAESTGTLDLTGPAATVTMDTGTGVTATLTIAGPAATFTADADASADGTIGASAPAAALTVDAAAQVDATLDLTGPAATFTATTARPVEVGNLGLTVAYRIGLTCDYRTELQPS